MKSHFHVGLDWLDLSFLLNSSKRLQTHLPELEFRLRQSLAGSVRAWRAAAAPTTTVGAGLTCEGERV